MPPALSGTLHPHATRRRSHLDVTPPPAAPSAILHALLTGYVAEWVRLVARRPIRPLIVVPPAESAEDDDADQSPASESDDGAVDATASVDAVDSADGGPSPTSSPDAVRSADQAPSSLAVRDGAAAPASRPAAESTPDEPRTAPVSAAAADAAEAAHRVVYVDAFARSGLYALERGPGGVLRPVDGERSVAAVRALFAAARAESDARHRVHAGAVLADEDPAHLAVLRDELGRHGLAGMMTEGPPADDLADGEVALVEAAFASAAGALGSLGDAPAHALVLLAPPTARALPWPALLSAVMGDNADVLLVLPYAELHRQADAGAVPVTDLPPASRRIVEGVSALLGDARHAWLAEWRRVEREAGRAAAEDAFTATLLGRLRSVCDDGVVRAQRIAPAGSADPAAALHLVHVTPFPAHALAMNEVMRRLGLANRTAAGDAGRAARVQPTEAETAVLELFAPAETHAGAAPASAPGDLPVDVIALAERIAAHFRGSTVAYRDVIAWLASTDVTLDEARRAMAVLKRTGLAAYRSLADDIAEVSFPVTPAPRRPPQRRPRGTPAEGSLFGEATPGG
jgi:hypothetical protein